MAIYKRILLASDLTKESCPVSDRAFALAESNNAELHVAHVVESNPAYFGPHGYIGIDNFEEQLRAEAEERMKSTGERLRVSSDRCYIELGSAKRNVLTIADRIEADLIVIGSHSHSFFQELLGSTANAVLHGATCDVLTVRYETE